MPRDSKPDAPLHPASVPKPAHTIPDAKPRLTLALGPAGSGKTEYILSRFLESPDRALLVVASPPQAETCAAALAFRLGCDAAEIRARVLPFRAFAGQIARSVPEGVVQTVSRAFQRLVLADLIPVALRRDDFLGRMLDAPGFAPALAERIREWKLACLTPDDLASGTLAASAMGDDPDFARKGAELARLFRAYQTFLTQNHLRDEEDILLSASRQAASLAALPQNASLLLVDGFYRFNPAQRELLAAVARRVAAEVIVTIPYEESRPLLFAAPRHTLSGLRDTFNTTEHVLPRRAGQRPDSLAILEANLFRQSRLPLTQPLETEAAGQSRQSDKTSRESNCLEIFDAPNPYVEAEMVARAFRRLHGSGGYRWQDFAILLRGMGDYAPILAAVFERYDIPLGVDGPEPLVENPLIKTILHLLNVARRGWQRDDVLAFLKSSYTAPSKLAADDLRRRAQKAKVRAGRDAWLQLTSEDGDSQHAPARILRDMARIADALTGGRQEPVAFAEMLHEIVEMFGMEARIPAGEPTRQARDRVGLKEGLEVAFAWAEMTRIAGRSAVTFAEFHDALLTAWQTSATINPPDGDYVRVAEPYDAREAPIRVAAVMGLTERVFPRRVTEDPFLRDDERAALRQAAGIDLELQRLRADDERLLFYLAVTAPTERVILSFPRSANESDTLPSFYLDEVRALFPDGIGLHTVSRTLADVAPQPHEVVSNGDRLLAACAELFDPPAGLESAERGERERTALALLADYGREPKEAQTVRSVVTSRYLPRLPVLESDDLRARFAGREPIYSVSELETFQRCPFQYLLSGVLHLSSDEDGTGTRAQGTLLHGVLRRWFRRRAAAKPIPPLPDAPTMRGELRAELNKALALESLDAHPHRIRMTRRMLEDALDGFVKREQAFAPQFGLTPAHFELAFGPQTTAAQPDDGGPATGEHDPASTTEPLWLEPKDGGPRIGISGTLDRVDVEATGKRALLLDYKLGKPPEYAEMLRGASLQMPLYLLALERLWDKTGAVACYDSAQATGRPRIQRSEHINLRIFAPLMPLDDAPTVKPLSRDEYAKLTTTAEAAAFATARAITNASVEARPGDHCHACAYKDVCRTTVLGGHDGEEKPMRF